MEQKKLLLVAVSVGVFFVIVIGAAILAFGPRTAPALAAAPLPAGSTGTYAPFYGLPPQPAEPAVANPSDVIREGVQGLQPAPEGTENRDSDFYIGNDRSDTAGSAAEGGGPRVVITVDPKTTAGVPDAAPAGKAVQASKPAVQPAPAVKPTPAARTAPAAKPVSRSVKTYDDYWVQTGSFTAKAHAEGVKETLASKGITSIIENRDIEGATFFRVRVGPYTSQNEADYWLSLIKSISGFEDSQVWKSRSTR
jgi:DedD protein